MPASSPIPALDPAPIPGPPWLFHVLWVFTFLIHVLFMNAVLGGSVVATLSLLFRKGEPGRRTASFLVEVNTWAISLAITFGIAPLLFLQVIYGRLFYTATILVAAHWLGLLVLLTAAYYLNYVAKYRFRAGKGATAAVASTAVLLLAIAAIQVAVSLLHQQPSRWASALGDPWAAFADRAFLPRWLHFVLAAVTLAAVLVAWLAVRNPDAAPEDADRADRARWGIKLALGATAAQLLVGFWLVGALPGPVLRGFMRGGAATMVPFTLAVVLGFGLLLVLARTVDPLAQRKLVRHALELFGLATILMLVTRHQLREVTLAAEGVTGAPAVAPQWSVLALFLVVLVLCVALSVWALVRMAKDRPGAGEEAA